LTVGSKRTKGEGGGDREGGPFFFGSTALKRLGKGRQHHICLSEKDCDDSHLPPGAGWGPGDILRSIRRAKKSHLVGEQILEQDDADVSSEEEEPGPTERAVKIKQPKYVRLQGLPNVHAGLHFHENVVEYGDGDEL
jgi:hypothetical protein